MLQKPLSSADRDAVLRLAAVHCPVALRRSTRAKRFSLKVSHTERTAILTLPNKGRVEDASAFLARHADWLNRQIERLPEPVPFADGTVIPLRGMLYTLRFAGPQRNRGIVWMDGAVAGNSSPEYHRDSVELCGDSPPAYLYVNGEADYAPRRLADWFRMEVRKDLQISIDAHAKTLGCYPKRISIRDQATRWGSCSTTGTLSFSWRLIFAPPFVLDYVAAHEVAHLREMNHGPRFWRLVRDAIPHMQKARNWLKINGSELHRFGAEV